MHTAESVQSLVAERAATAPDAGLVTSSGGTWTIAESEQRARRLATALREHGVQAGDRVAVMLPNGLEWVASWLGVLIAGAVLVPVNRGARRDDLAHVLRDSGASVVVTVADLAAGVLAARAHCPDLRSVLVLDDAESTGATSLAGWDRADPLPSMHDARRDDLASLQYTSGTTGPPKACMLTHGYWTSLARRVRDLVPLSGTDVVMTAQPFSYLDPQWNLMACLDAAARLVVLPRFSPSGFWPAVRQHGVTWLYVVGTMPLFLLDQPPEPADRDHQLRYVSCSGIVPDLHERMERRWGVPWREAFGMTETGVDLAVPLADVDCVGTGWLGDPIPTKQIRVVADGIDVPVGTGELWVRGEPMMIGYWRQPAATAEAMNDGWFRTGDLVRREASGHLRIVGRAKDMVRRAGENISAAEVEAVLAQHPAVLAVAVVPVPDRLRGEEVKAFVLPAAPDAPDPQELRDFVLGRLAAFKAPRYIEVVSSFPMTPSERIAKSALVHGPTWDAATGEWSSA